MHTMRSERRGEDTHEEHDSDEGHHPGESGHHSGDDGSRLYWGCMTPVNVQSGPRGTIVGVVKRGGSCREGIEGLGGS